MQPFNYSKAGLNTKWLTKDSHLFPVKMAINVNTILLFLFDRCMYNQSDTRITLQVSQPTTGQFSFFFF